MFVNVGDTTVNLENIATYKISLRRPEEQQYNYYLSHELLIVTSYGTNITVLIGSNEVNTFNDAIQQYNSVKMRQGQIVLRQM